MKELEKRFRKKSNPKNRKNSKQNQSEIAACEQKTNIEKENFYSNAVFSHNFELRAKFTPQNHSLFRFTSCFGVTEITTPI